MVKKKNAKSMELEDRIALCQDYTLRWSKFFDFFSDGFEGRKITADDEAQFFRAMTDLARLEYRVSYFLGKEFTMSKEVLGVLSDGVSLSNINEKTEAQFSKYQHSWHVIFIALNKALGRLIELRPPPKETKKKKSKGKK